MVGSPLHFCNSLYNLREELKINKHLTDNSLGLTCPAERHYLGAYCEYILTFTGS